jgi:hypothetical protein
MTFGLGEGVLSAWMEENALVAWIVHPKPWIAEAQLIARLDVPLNLDGNLGNPFHPSLAAARGRAVDRARKLPVMPNPDVPCFPRPEPGMAVEPLRTALEQ